MRPSWRTHNSARDGADGCAAYFFRVEIVPERDVVRVAPVGEVDIYTAGELRAEISELRQSGFARVILDLRGTTFIDSTGLHVILDEYAAAKADGVDLAIVPGSPAVQRIFEVTGLWVELPFVNGATAANGAVRDGSVQR